jgi:hypothetical protein
MSQTCQKRKWSVIRGLCRFKKLNIPWPLKDAIDGPKYERPLNLGKPRADQTTPRLRAQLLDRGRIIQSTELPNCRAEFNVLRLSRNYFAGDRESLPDPESWSNLPR